MEESTKRYACSCYGSKQGAWWGDSKINCRPLILLDVMDPASIASLADFIRSQYGRLDILFDELPDGKVNNAAIIGTTIDSDPLAASKITGSEKPRAGQLYWSVKTDMISNDTGTSSVDEAAVYPVKLALLPDGGPSGLLFRSG
ncbi:REDUCTASE putative-RELATED [Salix koriyanagi]|uniref:REDUCTASE putative-RELATED n=1 Tax=Salix koriyanagi TaxID=2511006 RepID=A0A9Q0TED5_9ROSI|nr:REDUCTASE putative-RELATED [Salix koriyanagi]